MRTKDYRRFMKSTNLTRRINNFYDYGWCDKTGYAEFKLGVELGKSFKWLGTTGCPCNCEMCSGYYKYKRPTLNQIQNIIKEYCDV